MSKVEELSHAEIWDDSALIDSWNDALEEYNHYHSLHARGEKVEEVLQSLDDSEAHANGGARSIVREDEAMIDQSENIDDAPHIQAPNETLYKAHTTEATVQYTPLPTNNQTGAIPSLASMPQVLVDADEALKNLMMSWYYAGYYTGLYEGQQKAQHAQAAQQPAQNPPHPTAKKQP